MPDEMHDALVAQDAEGAADMDLRQVHGFAHLREADGEDHGLADALRQSPPDAIEDGDQQMCEPLPRRPAADIDKCVLDPLYGTP